LSSPAAVVLISHGFGEHSGRYNHVAEIFNEQNVACFATDHYGHGQTEGLAGHIDKYELFLEELNALYNFSKTKYPNTPILLYGHSMGGNIVLNYLFRKNPDVVGTIVTGPWIDLAMPAPALLVGIGRLLRNILPRMRQPTGLDSSLVSRDPEVVKAYDEDPFVQGKISNAMGIDMLASSDYLRNYQGQVNQPLLIMHGEDDKIIKVEGSINLSKRLEGPVSLKIWPKLYHEIHNEKEQDQVFNFLISWLQQNIFSKSS